VEEGTAVAFGHSYNAEVWAECRREAAAFLREAKTRLGGEAGTPLDEAAEQYSLVASKLKEVRDLHPFRGPDDSNQKRIQSPEAASLLRAAGEAESRGLDALKRVIDAL
jgi:hypothetical protein